ncbi:MAG: alginate lyase family protein [Bacteroidales bacterium]|nr:alginate lyase family protein [Bacteroidales bacterium]
MKKELMLCGLLATALAVNAQTTDYDTDRGFIHPGGLHTQADFDRVRAQIAAGNETVNAAYKKLTSAAYAQSNVQTNALEVIVRGGGSGENYMHACRGAAMAYQNALRWKLADSKANAAAAVRILMAWANTTKDIGGDSNYALAAGLYGYEFAQAAELVRDYEGWSAEDFETFKQWMLSVWYPKAIGFLRGRNGTWENSGKWWQAPGHYWSNWGLCNALCVASIGVLCDDVFIYNQGMSYFKYDQCGTFADPRTEVPIKNDGLAEFLGNLVVTTYASDLETGAYGVLGQMNESGRDVGHSSMALGLAVDMAKVGWNQGDDLYAYLNHRLAAGIEYVAAQTQSIANLPWVNYHYASSGYYYSDSRAWLMTEPALGAHLRPYWGTVIGIYEGVKGVKMPFSELAYKDMGIDEGGLGSTSGGYDHLGYSVLMNTRDEQLCPAEKVPTELSGKMTYSGSFTTNLVPGLAKERARGNIDGKTIAHNELGGLVNTFSINNNTTVPAGQTLVLQPQLPEGEEDSGQWKWNTGETTRDITVSTDRSYVYRVTYTNARGVDSQLCFAIASTGDCRPDVLTPSMTVAGGEAVETSTMEVLYGKSVKMVAYPSAGWGTYKWNTGATTESISKSVTADAEYSVEFKNQGGAVSKQVFTVKMLPAVPYMTIGTGDDAVTTTTTATTASAATQAGVPVTLGLTLPTAVSASKVTWSDGSTGASLTIENPVASGTYSATFTLRNTEYTYTFNVYVTSSEATVIVPGQYVLRHVATDTYMTGNGKNEMVTFEAARWAGETPTSAAMTGDAAAQLWYVEGNNTPKYTFVNLATEDSLALAVSGRTAVAAYYPFFVDRAVGTNVIAMHTGTGSSAKYWNLDSDGVLVPASATQLSDFPFELIAVEQTDGLGNVKTTSQRIKAAECYDLVGRRVGVAGGMNLLRRGIYIVDGKKIVVK